jgi:MinD superfamily P-loop ATPase
MGVAPKPDPERNMYFPKIDPNKCKSRGECLKICPEAVFDHDSEGVQVARPGDCTKCEACVVFCPEQDIRVEEM